MQDAGSGKWGVLPCLQIPDRQPRRPGKSRADGQEVLPEGEEEWLAPIHSEPSLVKSAKACCHCAMPSRRPAVSCSSCSEWDGKLPPSLSLCRILAMASISCSLSCKRFSATVSPWTVR